MRSLVNELLDWRGIPTILGRGRFHRITLTEILRDLAPLNEGRDTGTESPTTPCGSTPSVTTTCREGGLPENPDGQGVQERFGWVRGVGLRLNSHRAARIKYEEINPLGALD